MFSLRRESSFSRHYKPPPCPEASTLTPAPVADASAVSWRWQTARIWSTQIWRSFALAARTCSLGGHATRIRRADHRSAYTLLIKMSSASSECTMAMYLVNIARREADAEGDRVFVGGDDDGAGEVLRATTLEVPLVHQVVRERARLGVEHKPPIKLTWHVNEDL